LPESWRRCPTTRIDQADTLAREECGASLLAILLKPDRYHFRKVNENEIAGIALNTGAEGGKIGLKSLLSNGDFRSAR